MLVPKRIFVLGLLLTAVWSPLRAANYTIPCNRLARLPLSRSRHLMPLMMGL